MWVSRKKLTEMNQRIRSLEDKQSELEKVTQESGGLYICTREPYSGKRIYKRVIVQQV